MNQHLLIFGSVMVVAWALGTFLWPHLVNNIYKRAILNQRFGDGPILINALYTEPQALFAEPLTAQSASSSNLMTVGVNHDTLTTAGWLDLSKGPQVLHVPDVSGRYYSVHPTSGIRRVFWPVSTHRQNTVSSFISVLPISPLQGANATGNASRWAACQGYDKNNLADSKQLCSQGRQRTLKIMEQQIDPRAPTDTSVQDRRVWEKDGKEMLRVPAGEFQYNDKKQKIYLPEFWIDKTPVTNSEFSHFVQATGYKTTAEKAGIGCANINGKWEDTPGADWQHPGGPMTDIQKKADHPVVQVSWEDAMAYAKWAGKRLPTEQEWEKAARGVDGREYPWGNQEPTHRLCNFNKHEERTTPVGKYSPQGDSLYGCVDMAGNIWEWTASGDESDGKVLRGGGWSHPAEYVRLVLRSIHNLYDRYDTDGFRCVIDPNPNI